MKVLNRLNRPEECTILLPSSSWPEGFEDGRSDLFRSNPEMTAGVISDTHGLIRQEALDALRRADLIIHAGDIGKYSVLQTLEAIAPVFAVRGNVDRDEWADSLPVSRVVEVESVRIYVVHDVKDLDIDPVAESIQMVISGHSHMPSIVERNGVTYLNPGSLGPRRFSLPISMAVMRISGRRIQARLVDLQSPSHRPR